MTLGDQGYIVDGDIRLTRIKFTLQAISKRYYRSSISGQQQDVVISKVEKAEAQRLRHGAFFN